MKLKFNKNQLSTALDTVQRAAQAKVVSNTNNGILIAARDGKVTFEANDYSIAIKTSCDAVIEEPGDVVIASTQMPGMIKLLPGDAVLMEKEEDKNICHFRAGSAHYQFPTRSYDDFPPVEEMDHVNSCSIRCEDFRSLTNQIQFAAATEKNNPVFTGILFEIKPQTFCMAATNMHRLALREITLNEPATTEGRFIVPAGILSDVCRLLPEEEGAVMEISWARSHVAFTFGSTYFMSTLINGQYPDVHRVVPTRFSTEVTFDLKELSNAIRMVSPISRDVNYNTVNFHMENNTVDIFAEDADIGGSRVSIPAQVEGQPLSIVFNCSYIEDIIKHSTGSTLIWHLMPNGPMLVEQEEDKTYVYVVTPMRGR
jgi:DNA polymerase-3 subunit beta